MKTSDKDMQRILEKLRKLMDLKVSALECGEPGEANAAAAGITRLLREYDLTLQDIPDSQKPQEPVDIEPVPFRFTYMHHKWYWALLDVLAKHNNCTIIRTRTKRGPGASNVSIMSSDANCIEGWCFTLSRSVRTASYTSASEDTQLEGRLPALDGAHAARHGRVHEELPRRLCRRAAPEAVRRTGTAAARELTALVVAHQAEIDEYLASMDVKTARTRPVKVDEKVLEEGREVGRSISLQKGLDGYSRSLRFLEGNSGISG